MVVKYSCFKLETPSGKKISRIGDAYIDNRSLLKTSNSLATNDNVPLGIITREMEEISQNFERKLFSTGGALNLEKCFWYLISWRREANGKATMATTIQTLEEIKLTQGYKLGEKVTIHRESCGIAQRTLGTWINPTGIMTHPDGTVQTEYTVGIW